MLAGIANDFRYGRRTMSRNRLLTAITVLTLAIGIGGNGAIFSIVNAVLLRPLPYPNPDRLMVIWENRPREGVNNNTVAPLDFVDWKARQNSFDNIAAEMQNVGDITGDGEPEKAPVWAVSPEYFKVFLLNPVMGRSFLPDDDGKHVVILNEAFWRRRFGGDPNVVGRSLMLNGETMEVVGVVSAPTMLTALWRTLDFRNQEMQTRTNHFLSVYGRLKAGMTAAAAQQYMDRIAAEIQNEVPNRNQEHGAHLQPLRERLVGDVQSSLVVLAVAVGFVLLIACANVANLLMARGVMRHRELAIRQAIGASRTRIVRQFLMECLWLAALSLGAALPLAICGTDLLKAIAPTNIPRLNEARLDWLVVAYLIGITLISAFASSLAPALQAMRIAPNDALKEHNPAAGASRKRLRHVLVVSEIALAFILLSGAGLMMRTLWNLIHVHPGFEAEQVMTMPIALSPLQLKNGTPRQFMMNLVEQTRALPGVTNVGMPSHLPLGFADARTAIVVEGFMPNPGEPARAHPRFVTPGYFDAMKIRLLEGRLPTERDAEPNAPPVVVVNRTAALRYWAGTTPIGKRMQILGSWREVTGVADDVKFWGLSERLDPEAYMPVYRNPANLVARAQGDPSAIANAIRAKVRELDANLPLSTIRPNDIVEQSVASPKFYLILLVIFGTMAVVLASAGIYGVISYTVTQSTREIGVKIALGAEPNAVLLSVLRQGIVLALISLSIGIPAGIGLTRLMGALLFGVNSHDPLTLTVVAVITVVIALLACYLPARRAANVDPIVALRYQ
jgi:predicted permease